MVDIDLKKYDYFELSKPQKRQAEKEHGRELLSLALNNEFSIDMNNLVICTGKYGKPYFDRTDNLFFNISHSGNYVAAAVSKNEVGIDVQHIRPIKEGLIGKLFNEEERNFIDKSPDKDRAFITLWALKESYIKAIGKGMSFPMRNINFSLKGFRGEMQGKISNQSGIYYVKDLGEYMLAVCSIGTEEPITFRLIES